MPRLNNATSNKWRCGLKKVDGAGSYNFQADSCKFPTEDIMGAKKFPFCLQIPTNGGLSAPNFVHFWGKKSPLQVSIYFGLARSH